RYQQLKTYVIRHLPADRFEVLALLLGAVVVGIALKGVFEFLQESLVGSVTHRTLFDLRNRFYRNVINHDIKQFKDNGSHQLMARFTNDTEMVGAGIRTLYGRVVAEPLRIVSCLVLACMICWQLTVLFMVLIPMALITMTKVSRLMKRATRRVLEGMSQIYKILQETFTGIRVVKAFTMEPYERRRFKRATDDYYHKAMKVVFIDSLAGPLVELLGVAAVALALLAGAYLVLKGKTHLFGLRMTNTPLDANTLLTLYALLAAIADPVRKLSSVYTKLQSGAAAADRIFAFMDQRPAVGGNPAGVRLGPVRDRIEFRDVCFSYEPGRPVLTNVQLVVEAGETIAVVGRNGSGKTTLLGLLPRFYDPDHGSVFIDGIDVRHANLRSLRRQVGVVTQETFLFDDTIYNNIAYGCRGATPEQVEEAARRAFVHDLIVAKLPRGYDTPLGEAGGKLSGGEKQKIALARAILRDPSILILDEFTSSYDAESEAQIHQALRAFMKGRTTFVITHRLNTLEIADRIVVLENSRVVAVGTHAELLASCPAYQRLHEAAFQRKSA
ncbi:MAG TPA: ABC transporter ATP-binding protein, partial [Gemmataceae bacterium]